MPRRLHTRLLALVVFVSLAMAASARAGELGIHTRDGVRTAIVLPASQAPAPTAIVLHGAINSPAWTARISGFTEAAQSGGFTAVFPKGAGLTWSDGRQWEKVDDVGFLRGLVAELIRRGIADPDRITACARDMVARPRDWPNPFGDGHAGERIVDRLLAGLG